LCCCGPICCPRPSRAATVETWLRGGLEISGRRHDGIDRGLLYVALTRAEDMLVILHSGSSSYVEELYRALGTVPP
jgi:hypothetical protein